MNHSGNNLENKVILIAEDDDSSFFYFKEVLNQIKLKLMRKINGIDVFIECLRNPNIYVVLMDIKIPGIDGFEATKLIKKYRPDIVVIAQTAYISAEIKIRCFNAGCDDYLSKPIMPEDLLNTINKILRKKAKHITN